MGLPGSWVIFFARAVHRDPAWCAAILAIVMVVAVAAGSVNTVGTRYILFGAYF
jgi:hypothetical protein